MSEKEKMNTQNKKEISGFLKGVEIIGNQELYRICPFGNSPYSHARCRCC